MTALRPPKCGNISLYFNLTRSPVRAGLFVAMGLSAIFPVIHAVMLLPVPLNSHHLTNPIQVNLLLSQMGLFYVVLQGVLYIVGACIYALRVPERWVPGKFDIFGASHQIFHGFVLAAAVTHFIGLCIAFEYWHERALEVGPGGDVCQ